MKYPVIKILSSNSNSIVHLIAFLFGFALLSGCGGELETSSLNGGGGGGGVGGTKSVSLTWDTPTTNEDGSCLTDLSNYKVYYGTSTGDYVTHDTVSLGSSSLSCVDTGLPTGCGNILSCTYTVQGLTDGAWHFVVTANDFSGNESFYSNETTKNTF